jgi:peptidoglycan/LPS O-acetylase OafA/YrhL
VVCYVYRACVFRAYGRTSVGRIATHWLPGFLDVFALGIALAAVSVYVVKHGSNPIVDLVARLSWLWWGLAACCVWIVTKHLGLIRSPQPQNTPIGWQADAQQLLQTLFAGLIALPAIFGPQDRGTIRKFLQCKPIAVAGLLSYGFYLWHEGWLEKWLEWTGRPNILQLIATHSRVAFTTYPLILVLTLVSSFATAALSYQLIDKPTLHLKNRIPKLFGGRGMRA